MVVGHDAAVFGAFENLGAVEQAEIFPLSQDAGDNFLSGSQGVVDLRHLLKADITVSAGVLAQILAKVVDQSVVAATDSLSVIAHGL